MEKRLSSQSQHWLNFFYRNPTVRINYTLLMEQGVSRRRSRDILRELKDMNYLRVVSNPGGGSSLKLVRSEGTTPVRSGYPYTAVQLVSSISNSYTASTANKATNKFLDEVEGKEKQVGYDFFEKTSSDDQEEILAARAKHVAEKKAAYAEIREEKAQRRKDLHRSKLDPAHWTCKDVAYEFADRMADIWSIKPFSVTQSRFVQALAVFRKQHDTNGAIELRIVELFFQSLQQDKYTDGNHLWRAFLYKAPALLQTAKESIITVEQRETAIIRDQELTERKLSIFDEDDDV